MAQSVNKTYHKSATARCQNCQSVYTLGMTVESLTLEICGNCHPFYTGQETLVDTAGRIDKFKARASKTADIGGSKTTKVATKSRKTRQSLADLSQPETVQQS